MNDDNDFAAMMEETKDDRIHDETRYEYSFDGLCETAITHLSDDMHIKSLIGFSSNKLKINTWDDLASVALLLYITHDIPYSQRHWLYPLCAISFKNSSLFKPVDINYDQLYHVSITPAEDSPELVSHEHIFNNGFMSASNEKSIEEFRSSCGRSNILFKVNMQYVKGALYVPDFIDSMNNWINENIINWSHAGVYDRVFKELEHIILFDKETSNKLLIKE